MGQKLMSFVEDLSADGDKNIVFKMSIPDRSGRIGPVQAQLERSRS